MKKLRFMRYLTYFTIILTLLSVLPGGAFAAKVSSEGNGDQNQYKRIPEAHMVMILTTQVMPITPNPILSGFRTTSIEFPNMDRKERK
jgi:hypothetical protein